MTGSAMEWGRWSMDFSGRPLIMGVINVTPDSFSDGGDFLSAKRAIDQGLQLVEQGADILDVGGESTRPGAAEVGEAEELDRVLPVIEALAANASVPISIDTYKAEVAEAALEAGAAIINDISGGRLDLNIFNVAARTGVPIILMHMKGEPRTMQQNPVYDDLMGEIKAFLADAASQAETAGVRPDRIILDPGIGFGKTFDHNLILLNRLREFQELGRPILLGPSRKAFLGQILGGAAPKDRDVATAAAVTLAAYNGAAILRVHNVDLARQVLAVAAAVLREHA
jgi:dihydropteroate synthase